MAKKQKFSDLKPGQKFRYKRKLYIKDELYCAVCLQDGSIPHGSERLYSDAVVTPVKVKITVIS